MRPGSAAAERHIRQYCYELTGPVKADSRLTCLAYYSVTPPSVPTAYFSAPARLVSGWGGIKMAGDDMLFRCAFQSENGTAKLSASGVGLAGTDMKKSNPIDAGMVSTACVREG